MIRLFNKNRVRGLGLIRFGSREVLNVSVFKFKTGARLGITIDISAEQPLHLGFMVGLYVLWIQLFGVQFDEYPDDEEDVAAATRKEPEHG